MQSFRIPGYCSVVPSMTGPLMTSHPSSFPTPTTALVVEVDGVGICRSDLKQLVGDPSASHYFGHELVGRVVWAAPAVARSPGDRVSFNPNIANVERNSGFSHVLVASGHHRDIEHAFPRIPDGVDFERAVFIEPLACASHGVNKLLTYLERTRLDRLDVAIIGAGITGTLIGLLCRHLGARVTIFNRGHKRLAFLAERHLFETHELRQLAHDSDASLRASYDVVIPTITRLTNSVLSTGADLLRPMGFMLLYGGTKVGDLFPRSQVDIDSLRRRQQKTYLDIYRDADATHKRITIGGTHGADISDYQYAIDALTASAEAFPLHQLITDTIALDALVPTLRSLSTNEGDVGKVVVRF